MKEDEARARQTKALESMDQSLKLILYHLVRGEDQATTEETEPESVREARYPRRSEA